MMVQSVSGVNLGSRIKVSVGNLDQFEIIGRGLQQVYNSWRSAGAWFSGDWVSVIRVFRTMKSRMGQSLENANRVVAVMYFHDVQGAWETQEFASTWQPLNPDYLAQKIADQLDRRTLIRTGDALASLGVELEDDLSLVVGVTVEDDQGEAYMVTQEFGSSDGRIPARPLFFPVLENQQNRYIRVFLDAIEKTLTGGVYTNFAAGVIS
jgi:hypothetical protein